LSNSLSLWLNNTKCKCDMCEQFPRAVRSWTIQSLLLPALYNAASHTHTRHLRITYCLANQRKVRRRSRLKFRRVRTCMWHQSRQAGQSSPRTPRHCRQLLRLRIVTLVPERTWRYRMGPLGPAAPDPDSLSVHPPRCHTQGSRRLQRAQS
jgi:hypothetical protein